MKFETLEARQLLAGSSVLKPAVLPPTNVDGNAPNAKALTPAQIRAAYRFDQVDFNGTAADGRGTTIAIVDPFGDPSILSDVNTFSRQFNFVQFNQPNTAGPTLRVVNQNGGNQQPPANPLWRPEIAMDVEWAHAIAPRANILLVLAASDQPADMFKAIDYARKQPGVVAISISATVAEYKTEVLDDYHFKAPPGHIGETFVVAAGDNGQVATYPSSSPNVLSVGGTHLTLKNGAWSAESLWALSGGGTSLYEPSPSYQGGGIGRSTPDVAFNADTASPYAVFSGGNGGWIRMAGTSVAAPAWAGLIAIVNEGRTLARRAALGNIQAAVYNLARNDFHDVGLGLGSPIADRVIPDLVAYTLSTNFTPGTFPPNSTPTTPVPAPNGPWWFSPFLPAAVIVGGGAAAGAATSGATTGTIDAAAALDSNAAAGQPNGADSVALPIQGHVDALFAHEDGQAIKSTLTLPNVDGSEAHFGLTMRRFLHSAQDASDHPALDEFFAHLN